LSRGGDVEIVVTDQGRGIAAEVRERIFEPFVTTKQDGLGLGLAIARSIVESHGGKIWAVPHAPHGVAFHVMLPASRRKQEQADE
jgi:two-component system sensor kinase FixL